MGALFTPSPAKQAQHAHLNLNKACMRAKAHFFYMNPCLLCNFQAITAFLRPLPVLSCLQLRRYSWASYVRPRPKSTVGPVQMPWPGFPLKKEEMNREIINK